MVFLGSLPEQKARGFPRLWKHVRRDDLKVVPQDIRLLQANTLDHVKVAIVRYTDGFAHGNIRLGQYSDRVHHQRIALPVADRVTVKSRVRIGRVSSAIRVNSPQS